MIKYLLDTNILIDYLNKIESAVYFIEKNIDKIGISHITVYEILAGSRNQIEMKKNSEFLNLFYIFYEDENISKSAIDIVKAYFLRDGIKYFDASIAATAITENIPLVTRDKKHMSKIKGLKIKEI